MPVTAFTVSVTIPSGRIAGFRELLTELEKDISGLAERARAVAHESELTNGRIRDIANVSGPRR